MTYTNGKKVLDASGFDAVYTSCEYMCRYLTGMAAEDGCVLVDKSGVTFYTDSRYIEAAKKLFDGTDVTPTVQKRAEIVARLAKYPSVGISFRETRHEEYLTLENAGIKLFNADEAFTKCMLVKSEWELLNIERACQIAEDAFNMLLPKIREGMTETTVAAMLEYNMRKLGAQGLAFETIVAFGANGAVPHHETGLTVLKFGDPVLIDFGCRVNGYCSDITRTFLFGDDGKHEDFKRAYAHVLKAHLLAQEKIVAGMNGVQADAVAREYLNEKGYGQLFTHSLGHGIGLNVHEAPALSPRASEALLRDGMVFSDEPGVYIEGEFGIRIEDTVTLKNGKIKSFMGNTQKTLLILEV